MPQSRNNRNSSPDQRKFTVYMNEGERDQINKWVQPHQNIETGGDLFGAWIDNRTAVVQFVLGPGEKCRRSGVSFFQDIDYLRNAGSYLTQKHGLCNIGQWHSHHRLRLTRPSGGDENTVWGNMPNLGLDRYIVIIATIPESHSNGEPTVNINPYLFEIKNGRKSGVISGSFSFLEQNSPFRMDQGIENEVRQGAEITNPVTIYPETETETRNAGKRPHENESDRSANKIAKTEAEDMSDRITQSPARKAENFDKNEGEPLEIPAGDGTGRNAEDVRNENKENGQFTISQGDGTEENLEDVSGNDDEVREQSNVGQSDATKHKPEDVPNNVEESKESNISQDETTRENQNIWNDDEASVNMEQGGATDRTSEDVPNTDEESTQSTILQDEAKKKNQNISNEDEVSKLSNMEQGGANDITPEDVPNKDEESEQSTISQDEAKKQNQNISNEDEVSDQSNLRPGEAIERNTEKDPTQEEESRQFNTAQGYGMEQTPKDFTNENEESRKSSIPPEGSPNSSNKEVNGHSNIGQEVVPTEDAETRQLSILRDGSESNVQAEVDSNMMDVDDHEEDSLFKASEAESQIRDDNGIAFNSEGFRGTQSKLPNFPNTDSNPQKTPQDDSTIETTDKDASEKDQVKSNTALRDEVFGDEQPKTPTNEVDSNTSNHVTSTSPDDNDQLSKSDAQEHPKQDFLQNDSERTLSNDDDQENKVEGGQSEQSDILQKEGKRDSKQSFDENSLKQDDYNKTDIKGTKNDFEKKDDDKTAKDDKEFDNNVQKTSQVNLETMETFEKHGSNNDRVEFKTPLLSDVPIDEQSKISPNDVSNNLDVKQDLNDTGKHVTLISSDTNNENQNDAVDIINEQLSTSDTKRHDQDFLLDPKVNVLNSNEAKKVEAIDTTDGCEQLDIVQKDTDNDLKQNLDKDSLNHFPTKRVDYKTEEKRANNEKDEDTTAKNDRELDGAIADETMPLESNKEQNSGVQKRRGELNGAQGCEEIRNATESLNIPVVKPGKRKSRSIFDSLEEPDEKQELTSNNEMHEENSGTKDGVNTFKQNETNNEGKNSQDTTEADAKIKTEDGVDTFTENEKNEGKDWQDSEQSWPDPQSDESNETTQIEKTGSDTAKNNEVAENSNKNGPSASEIEIEEDKAVNIEVDQNEMDHITVHKKGEKKKKRFTLRRKKSKKSESQDGNGENETTKRKSKCGKSRTEKTNVNIESDTYEADTNTEFEDMVETTEKKRTLLRRIFGKSKQKKAKVHIENETDENIEKTTKQESKVQTSEKIKKQKESSEKKGNKKEKKKDKKEKKKEKKSGAEKMEIDEKEKT